MIEITIPRLGWSMEEGTFSEWLKRDGDWVEKGDMLFVLESDKAAQEIESFESGVLRLPASAPSVGQVVSVGQVIGYLVAREEVESFVPPETAPLQPAAAQPEPMAAKVATEEKIPEAGVAVVGAEKATASPRARRAANERGIDWKLLSGSGRDGRVRERDVLAAAVPATEKGLSAPLSATRRTIAERMLASVRATAPVTLTTKIDAGNLVNLRAQFKLAGKEPPPTITDIVVKLAAKALSSHPNMNARWQEGSIVRVDEIQIGIAVDTDAGLLVPVIRDVPTLGIIQIAERSHSLIEKARARRLTGFELTGGTFTVTNLGMYGIDAFTPIINLPETAILGVGAIRRDAIVLDDDRIVPGHSLTLSLTFDHRLVDGAPAARFLQSLRKLLENPAASLVD
ncbi:MAG TPA: dihydrolipoamide acetyltransferase family protein [Pirellulales bacterium]|nr:dihydrolipoamide acetyltransferase family protein [Pirellulales bacterium]